MANTEEVKQFESWEEVILDFFEKKRDIEEEKYLKEEIKIIGKAFESSKLLEDEEIAFIFDAKKMKKQKDEASLSFQRYRARKVMHTQHTCSIDIDYTQARKNYFKKIRLLMDKYNPKNWLTENCKNASSVSFATHVAKLTHSKIDSPSIFDSINVKNNSLLTTSSLVNRVIDGAVAGNQFAPIFQFLELELNGKKLAERLAEDDAIFLCFAPENNMSKQWVNGFRVALKSKAIATHKLLKQVYFPVDDNYHLLSNMLSSSLAHQIYNSVYDDEQKKLKIVFDKSKYHVKEIARYTQRSQLSVTASNHSNASQLNGKRGGKLHLFSCQPPTWQSHLKPPVYQKSLFDNLYHANIETEVGYLRDFLLRFNRLDLSIKDPKRRRHLERWVNNIIDEFIFYVGSIQALPAGWSAAESVKLKPAHQYLLDPCRQDEAFQNARQSTDWNATISADFAQWLNYQLRGKDNQFTPKAEHIRLWKKLLSAPLREYMESVELEAKQQGKEVV